MKMSVTKNIAKYINDIGINLSDLARKAGVEYSAIYDSLHYLLVTGYEFVVLRAHLISEWGQDKRTTVKHYFIEREEVQEDLDMLLEEEKKFWRYVESGRKPPLLLPEI